VGAVSNTLYGTTHGACGENARRELRLCINNVIGD